MDNHYRSIRSIVIKKYKEGTPFNYDTEIILGCDINVLCNYIDVHKSANMTLDNMGTYWTIGYILTEDEAGSSARRTHYTNFYPLVKGDPTNIRSRVVVPAALKHEKKRCVPLAGVTMAVALSQVENPQENASDKLITKLLQPPSSRSQPEPLETTITSAPTSQLGKRAATEHSECVFVYFQPAKRQRIGVA